MNIDEILESGDPEAMEALLDQMSTVEDSEGALLSVEHDEQVEEKSVATDAKSDDTPAAVDEQKAAPKAEEEPTSPSDVLMSKDGKHQIPYSVLENARTQAQEFRTQAEQFAAEKTALETQLAENQRLLDLRSTQLSTNNIAPKELPENVKYSEEQLAALEEEYGELGALQVANYRQLQAMQARQQPAAEHNPAPSTADPVETAIQANTDLSAWRSSDPDRFDFAVSVDNTLKGDPNFATKSMGERFAEVARRTKAAFGDPLTPVDAQAKANAAIEAATPTTPSSLSDVGASTPDAEKTLVQRLAEQNPDDLMASMEGMTDDQIDALLAQSIY